MSTFTVLCTTESQTECEIKIDAINPVELGNVLEDSGYQKVVIYNAYGVEVYNTDGDYFPYH